MSPGLMSAAVHSPTAATASATSSLVTETSKPNTRISSRFIGLETRMPFGSKASLNRAVDQL